MPGLDAGRRQAAQPGPRRLADPAARPLHRRLGVRVEPVDLGPAERGEVVVAGDADRADPGQPLDDAVRVRPVADDVAEVPDGVDRAGRGEDGVEGDEVGMDVREDGDAHRASLARASRAHGRALVSPRAGASAVAGSRGQTGSIGVPGRARRRRGDGRRARRSAGSARIGDSTLDPCAPGSIARERPTRARRSRLRARPDRVGSPRFQATRMPPGSRSGQRQLDELGQRRDGPRRDRRPAAAVGAARDERLGAGRLGRHVLAQPRRPRRPWRGSGPSCRSNRRAAPGRAGRAAASGMPGKAAAAAEVDEPVDAARPEEPDGASGCRRHGGRRSRPGRGSRSG